VDDVISGAGLGCFWPRSLVIGSQLQEGSVLLKFLWKLG